MTMVSVTIDKTPVEVPRGITILEAADQAEIYIPRPCAHPDLPNIDLNPLQQVFRGTLSIQN